MYELQLTDWVEVGRGMVGRQACSKPERHERISLGSNE